MTIETKTQVEHELDAILHGVAFAPMPDCALLRITGPDATRWLNGMVTNNVRDLQPGRGNYNFLLNNQGRIVGDCTLYREPGDDPAFLLQTSASQLPTIHPTLDRFIIMDDVELTPALTGSRGILFFGTLPLTVSGPPISLSYAPEIPGEPLVLHAAPDRYELWGDAATLDWVASLGRSEVSPAALEASRILSGTPRYGIDIRNTDAAKDLPQETGQAHALNFNKGCYLGQEIVERIHSRGQVHRQFTAFALTGELPATLPQPLTANGKPAGELTSAIALGDTLYALGYARREALESNAPLTYPGGTATARQSKQHPLI